MPEPPLTQAASCSILSDDGHPAGLLTPLVADVEAFGWAAQDAWQSLSPVNIIQSVSSIDFEYRYDIERLSNGHWLVAFNIDTNTANESETWVVQYDANGNTVFASKVGDNTTAPAG